MTMPNTTPIFGAKANNVALELDSGDTTTLVDLVVAGSLGTKLQAIGVTTDDTSDVDLKVYLHDGSSAFQIGTVNIPTLSGTDGVNVSVNALNLVDMPFLDAAGEAFLPSGWKVQVGCLATMTAAKVTHVIGYGIDY